MCHKAIEVAKPGDVLVINAGGCDDAAVWGDLTSVSAKALGIQGIVVDGAVRDIDDIEQLRFPVFAIAVVPRSGVKATPGWVNLPIQCGGVNVEPRDAVVETRMEWL